MTEKKLREKVTIRRMQQCCYKVTITFRGKEYSCTSNNSLAWDDLGSDFTAATTRPTSSALLPSTKSVKEQTTFSITTNMRTNKIYKTQLEAARRLAGWVDRHPYVTNIIIATGAAVCALYVFFYYPL